MSEDKTTSFAWLHGKRFIESPNGELVTYFVEGPDPNNVDYVMVAPAYLPGERYEDAPNIAISRYAPHIASLVMLYDLYMAANELFDNLAETDALIHEDDGYIYPDVLELWRALDNVDTWKSGKEVEPLLDQYDDRVPDDLVCLPNLAQFREMQEAKFDPDIVAEHMDWYEVRGLGLLLTSVRQVPIYMRHWFNNIDAYTFDYGEKLEVDYVARSLHRYSYEDGFYHA